MARRSDGMKAAQLRRYDAAVLATASSGDLYRLLLGELALLERESEPGADWRLRRRRVQFCSAIAGELRRRGDQMGLFA